MTTRLIQRDVWTAITGSARRTKRRSWVAVAYFGKDGQAAPTTPWEPSCCGR